MYLRKVEEFESSLQLRHDELKEIPVESTDDRDDVIKKIKSVESDILKFIVKLTPLESNPKIRKRHGSQKTMHKTEKKRTESKNLRPQKVRRSEDASSH